MSKDFKIKNHVLSAMLRIHPSMTHLVAYIDNSKAPGDFPGGLPGAVHVQDGLRNLEYITIRSSGIRSYEDLFTWFPYPPALTMVAIVGDKSEAGSKFQGWKSLPSHAPLLKLRWLSLSDLQLSDSADVVVAALHLPSLVILDTKHCSNVAPLFRALAKSFRNTDCSAMEDLVFLSLEVSEEEPEALEELFASVDGLTRVVYSTAVGLLPKLDSLQGCAG
jgi:hypothetical protein